MPALLRALADAQEAHAAARESEATAARDIAQPFRVIGNTVRVPFGSVRCHGAGRPQAPPCLLDRNNLDDWTSERH